MFISLKDYLKRITYSLEHVVAPELESDYAKGQLLAAVFLLDQLTDRAEYKGSLIEQEIDLSTQSISEIIAAFEDVAIEVPAELKEFITELGDENCKKDLKLRETSEKMMGLAIEQLFANKHKLPDETAHQLNGMIIRQLNRITSRDMGMLKPSTSGKLIQRKKSK